MTFAMILDVLVVLLLVPTIIFAVILNGRLSALRKNREELGRLIAAFNDATVRAEAGIPRLKRTSEEASKALQEKVEKAQMLRDDLAFMIERADQMASRLETAVRDAQEIPRVEPRGDGREAARQNVAAPLAPLPHGLDIESAAAAAERAAEEALRAAQEAEMGLSEWAPGERRPEDRARAEKLAAGRTESAPPQRSAAPRSNVPARTENPRYDDGMPPAKARPAAERGPFDAAAGSAEHALAERILKEQAAAFGNEGRSALPRSAERAAERILERQAERPQERPAPRQPERQPERLLERPQERPLERPQERKEAPNGAQSRSARSGKLLGAALADEPARTVGRSTPQPRKAPAAREDEERSEAERELLRALRSVR
jgi:hypothetical protein